MNHPSEETYFQSIKEKERYFAQRRGKGEIANHMLMLTTSKNCKSMKDLKIISSKMITESRPL